MIIFLGAIFDAVVDMGEEELSVMGKPIGGLSLCLQFWDRRRLSILWMDLRQSGKNGGKSFQKEEHYIVSYEEFQCLVFVKVLSLGSRTTSTKELGSSNKDRYKNFCPVFFSLVKTCVTRSHLSKFAGRHQFYSFFLQQCPTGHH